jgi:L-amino acid N-acyltransferase YncA
MQICEMQEQDVEAAKAIWNKIVDDGLAFPQLDSFNSEEAKRFFESQTYSAVAKENGEVVGMYILHPNNVGRCGHIANASYGVRSDRRGRHIGEKLVKDCLRMAKEKGFRILQFNAVVDSNVHARHLYERLGFKEVGVIKDGFLLKNGTYDDIHVMYHDLKDC